jgi:predicted nucleic acid-binding protein
VPARPAERPAILAGHLRALCGAADHLFWPDTISLLDAARLDLAAVPQRQLTDVYLAALARAHGGVLATFDSSIFAAAAPGADLEVIGGVEP